MKERSDKELLWEYAEQGSERAFGEIVARYTDLVYSAALRQVGSADLARDIAQTVFTDLARKAVAGQLRPDASLAGWLYRATRYAALRHLRDEHRRQARERQAMQYFTPAAEGPLDWDRLAPVLDEAMSTLNNTDREALLLRFFKKHDFRAVGAALGLSDDAAQKRVTRSLDKLRAALSKRGVTATALTLSTLLSLNAVQAAPVGLAAALATASLASAAAGTGAAVSLLELMAMTKGQLGAVGAIIAASVLTPLVIQHQAQGKLRETDALVQQENNRLAELSAANQVLSNLLATTGGSPTASNEQSSELLRLRGQVARLRKDVQELGQMKAPAPKSRTDMLASLAQRYSDRVNNLKSLFETNPSERIPELQFLTDSDWLMIINRVTQTEDGYRRAMSLARQVGEQNFVNDNLHPALQKFAQDNNGHFPGDLAQLKPYFKSAVDDPVLERWAVLPRSKLTRAVTLHMQPDENWVITQKAPVNASLDQRTFCSLKRVNSFATAPPEQWIVLP